MSILGKDRLEEMRAAVFATNRGDFLSRLAEHRREDAEKAMKAKEQIAKMRSRLAAADEMLDSLHLGSAFAVLHIAQKELEAAIETLKL